MQNKTPKVSVLMPVYNGERYIKEAINSILAQSFTNFELVIIDDCSSDNTIKIIRAYDDHRIKLIVNEENQGSSESRNVGLKYCNGEYIAILDSDDWSYPTRLEKQVNFLDSNPDFAVIGAFMESINKDGSVMENIWSFPAPPEEIPIILFFSIYFAHSATMIRKSALPVEETYRKDLHPAEDYGVWMRINKKYKMWNLQEVLVKIRNHGQNTSILNKWKYPKVMQIIYSHQLSKLNFSYTPEELENHYLFCTGQLKNTKENNIRLGLWFDKLNSANIAKSYYDKILFTKALLGRWYLFCKNSDKNWWLPSKTFWHSSLWYLSGLTLIERFIFFGKFFKQVFRKIANTFKKV